MLVQKKELVTRFLPWKVWCITSGNKLHWKKKKKLFSENKEKATKFKLKENLQCAARYENMYIIVQRKKNAKKSSTFTNFRGKWWFYILLINI